MVVTAPTRSLLLQGWDWEPSVLIGVGLLAIGFLAWVRPRRPRHTALWFTALAVLLLALVSPIDPLSDEYLFSAHMLQHLLLLEVVCPLLILALPGAWLERVLPRTGKLEALLTHPLLAWPFAMLSLLLWHLPGPYNAALASENVHIVMHVNFLVSWTIFWWPLLAAPPARRYRAPLALPYLITASMLSMLLGIAYFFMPAGAYPLYLHAGAGADPRGWLPLLQGWGLYPRADQQLGGLIMWVPGSLVFLIACFALVVRWMVPTSPLAASLSPVPASENLGASVTAVPLPLSAETASNLEPFAAEDSLP